MRTPFLNLEKAIGQRNKTSSRATKTPISPNFDYKYHLSYCQQESEILSKVLSLRLKQRKLKGFEL